MLNFLKVDEQIMNLKDIEVLFNKDSFKKSMEANIAHILRRTNKKTKFSLTTKTSEIYTDGNKIVVGLPNEYIGSQYWEIHSMVKASVGHEAAHVKWSNFESLKDYLDEVSKRGYIQSIGQSIFNIIEDGRIERLLCEELQGYKKHINYLNLKLIEKDGIVEKKDEVFGNIISVMLFLSVLGKYPKNYTDILDEKDRDFIDNEILPLLLKGVMSNSYEVVADVSLEILDLLKDYMPIKNNKMPDELKDLLDALSNESYHSSDGQVGDDSNIEELVSGSLQIIIESKDGQNNSSSSQKGNDTQDDLEESKNDNTKGENNSQDCGENNSKDKENSQKGESNNSKDENNPQENNNDDFKGNEKANDNSKNSNEENSDDKMNELKDEVKNDVERALINIKNREKNSEESKGKNTDSTVDYEQIDVSVINSSYTSKRQEPNFKYNYPNYAFLEPQDEFKLKINSLKNTFNKVLKNTEDYSKGQKKGKINTSKLWRLGINERDIFDKKNKIEKIDYAVEILLDMSGSMYDYTKYRNAVSAAICIEGALMQLKDVEVKTVTFNYLSSGSNLNVFKDFKDKKTKTPQLLNMDFTDGSNRDGFAIRVALEDLKRHKAKNKLLVIISDGAPSCEIETYEESYADVKSAVHEGRKDATIVSILIDNKPITSHTREVFTYMYEEKGTIMVDVDKNPDDLIKNIVLYLKKVFKQ